MQKDVNGNKRGAYGFEDVVNTGSNIGMPSGGVAPGPGEDVEQPGPPPDVGFGVLETVGSNNLGLGFGFPANALKDTGGVTPSFTPINSGCKRGRPNSVSGTRQASRLLDRPPRHSPLS